MGFLCQKGDRHTDRQTAAALGHYNNFLQMFSKTTHDDDGMSNEALATKWYSIETRDLHTNFINPNGMVETKRLAYKLYFTNPMVWYRD
jgi:hypothetical protein